MLQAFFFFFVTGPGYPFFSEPSLNPFTIKKVDYKKKISDSRAVITARDDYIVPFQFSQNLSKQLDTSFHPIENGGHFLEDDGFIAFPLVYDILNNMMKTV